MNLQDKKQDFEKCIEQVVQDIGSVRTSRATPSLVENIMIDVYGVKTPIVQLASISSPETKQLIVEPWDKNILKDMEKAIELAGLGLSVSNEGNSLRLSMPSMTEETRQQIIKVLHEKLEKGRINLRGLRDNIKEEINSVFKNKEISEDEKFTLMDQLDKMTREYTDKIAEVGKKKEEEITL